jgi:hypothetical protein
MNHAMKFKSGYETITAADTVARGEANDCVVRAFMNAAQITYTAAHRIVADVFDRQRGRGTMGTIPKLKQLISSNAVIIPGRHIECLGTSIRVGDFTKAEAAEKGYLINPKYPKGGGRFAAYTVGKFLQQHPVGAYIVIVKGHALAIRDGIMYENPDQLDKLFLRTGRDQRRVFAVFKIS